MKMRYQFLIGILLLGVCVLSGCSEDEYYFLNNGNGSTSSACPYDYTCFDVSSAVSNPYSYNVSSSGDEPYSLDVSA